MSNCIDNEFYCSGCAACSVICPSGAISIIVTQDGFYSAMLDKTKCINCEKCLQVCGKFEYNYPKLKKFTEFPLYAGWSLDKKSQYETSSGGIGFEIAKWGIENKYKIAGVVYDYETNKAKTVIAETLDDIEPFKGSKYLQSFCADAFKYIINSEEQFIVFGTPCQIAGLRMLAKEKQCEERLILIDFFCHGVPTYLLWQSFLKWLKEKNKITMIKGIRFRDKKYGWHNFTMKIETQAQSFFFKIKKNPFYTLFFCDLLLNDKCYLCESKSSFDFADIRLGDFWGSTFDFREDGISAVAVFSNGGKNILDKLTLDKRIILLDQEHSVCMKNQASFKKADFNSYKERQLLMNLLKDKLDISNVQKKYIKILSFKKRTFLMIKKILPDFLIIKFRRFYHFYNGR